MVLKIVRILIDSSGHNAREVYSELNIFPSVMAYLAYYDWYFLSSFSNRFSSGILLREILEMIAGNLWIISHWSNLLS
jgi:hypothetical protein